LKRLKTIAAATARQISILAFLLCVTWMPAKVALASDEPAVVFAIPDVWPWAYEDRDGIPRGSLIQVTNRLSELTGVPIETRLRPLRRALIELNSGEVNFSLLFQSPAMDSRATNVAQVMKINIMLAASVDTDYPLTLETLKGRRIGYIRGTYLGDAFERDTDVEKVPVAVISQGIEMLDLGRLSAILASDHAIIRSLQSMGRSNDELRFRRHKLGQAGTLYMSRRAPRPAVAEKFRVAIATMTESNELNRIFFGDAGRPEHDDTGGSIGQSPVQ
jgi:ABC-type amino acid transport substrate-binding protein